MSQTPDPPFDPIDGDPAPKEPARAASVTLRGQSGPSSAQPLSLDPAQKSLAEALRITFFLLQIGMVVLAGLFVLSGARQIREAERGIKLFLGRVVDQDVQPGLRFAWPYPVGEFVTVETGQVSLDVADSFFPQLSAAQKLQPLDNLNLITRGGLRPGLDGGLITGDGNIVHARWAVVYRRDQPASFVRNVYPLNEADLVRAAIERGVVRTVAEMPIDAVLKQAAGSASPAPASTGEAPTPSAPPAAEDAPAEQPAPAEIPAAAPALAAAAAAGPESTIAARVREIAQETLDAMDSGIVIERVVMVEPTPPLPVRRNFNQVQAAQSTAEKEREQAEKERRETLNAVAGAAHEVLLARIGDYERALELGAEEEAEKIIAEIDRILEGGASGTGRADAVISGEAANIISDARLYRTEIVSSSRLAVETFRAKLEQYRVSPALLLNREWTDAYLAFLGNPTTQVMMLPPGSSLELWLNSDPEFAKAIEEARNAAEILRSLTDREQQFRQLQRSQDRLRGGVSAN
ncbi:MAG: hypothetical protein IBJ10_09190 [Phycisphaerales bacterium]|nr:hypothetical protein [Phycisphaerales bacterium]